MKLAYIIYNNITWLDFIGIYDPLCRLKAYGYIPDLKWDVCSFTKTVSDSFDLEVIPAQVNTTLAHYDGIIIPGGFGTRALINDNAFMDWIKTANEVTYKISICTGGLILGAAGFLKDKKATTHFDEYEALKPFCREVIRERIVDDGNFITAGAVSSSIDLGLYLCEKWSGIEAKQEIIKRMDYRGYCI